MTKLYLVRHGETFDNERQIMQGQTSIYQTNKQFPILKELQSIVIKSQQLDDAKKTPSKIIG